jgi:hypothetical protein
MADKSIYVEETINAPLNLTMNIAKQAIIWIPSVVNTQINKEQISDKPKKFRTKYISKRCYDKKPIAQLVKRSSGTIFETDTFRYSLGNIGSEQNPIIKFFFVNQVAGANTDKDKMIAQLALLKTAVEYIYSGNNTLLGEYRVKLSEYYDNMSEQDKLRSSKIDRFKHLQRYRQIYMKKKFNSKV